ncbi:hypothetical protein B0T13DRAFT_444779 [Neurospora crassa]|nr:hypothetical protein B0T13DRAFT_444779 [Neurospora crassa]
MVDPSSRNLHSGVSRPGAEMPSMVQSWEEGRREGSADRATWSKTTQKSSLSSSTSSSRLWQLAKQSTSPCGPDVGEHADQQTKQQQASSSRSLVNAAVSSPVDLFNAGRDTRILSGQEKTCQKGHLPLHCLPRQPLTTREQVKPRNVWLANVGVTLLACSHWLGQHLFGYRNLMEALGSTARSSRKAGNDVTTVAERLGHEV